MTIDTSGSTPIVQSSSSLLKPLVPRTRSDAPNARVRKDVPGQTRFRDAVMQSLAQAATHATAPAPSSSYAPGDAAGPAQDSVPDQALAGFVQDLFAALARDTAEGGDTPPDPQSAGLTREALASSLDEANGEDSNRYARKQALLNDFETADTDGDGAISRAQAHAFNEANGIPTIEDGAMVGAHQASVARSYPSGFGAQIAAKLQELIERLATVKVTSTDASAAAAEGAMPSATDPTLEALEDSYGQLAGAVGGDSGAGSLMHFLETRKGKLETLAPSGNFLSTTA